MKQNNFEKELLDNKIVDYRNLYSFVVKKRVVFPSLSILVMGLYKEKLVFFKVSTSYHLIKFIEEIEIKNINEFEIVNTRSSLVLKLKTNKVLKKYDVVEHSKDLYTIKKILKK